MQRPYGGKLINNILSEEKFGALANNAADKPIIINTNDIIHLNNIASGVYSPLAGFMKKEDYISVLQNICLENGLSWTLPVLLHISDQDAKRLKMGQYVLLQDQQFKTIGIIQVESIFGVDPDEYSCNIYGTRDATHPGVGQFLSRPKACVGGDIFLKKDSVAMPDYWETASDHRDLIKKKGFERITAFSTRNVCHIGHEYLHSFALESTSALGINVITGAQMNGSILSEIIFETYEIIAKKYYPVGRVLFNNLRIPPIYAGPKEAYFQAVILQNYGYTDFIVGRDHAGVSDYYEKYASQQIFNKLNSLDINIMAISEPRFCLVCDKVTTQKSCPHKGNKVIGLNGREVRKWIQGQERAELTKVLRPELRAYFDEKLSLSGYIDQNSIERKMENIFYKE